MQLEKHCLETVSWDSLAPAFEGLFHYYVTLTALTKLYI